MSSPEATPARNILVTGGCGFIGRALAEGFIALGHKVTVLDMSERNQPAGASFVRCDIRDQAALIQACAGMDSIIHSASVVHTANNRADDIWAINHGGSLNVIEACKVHRIPRLVYISSASAMYEGRDIENGDESLPYSRISQAPYADSKIQAEKDSLKFSGSAQTLSCAIRPHVVFGPGDQRFIPAIVEKAQQGKLKRAIGKRDKLSDFTYISNLVDAVIAAEQRLNNGSPVCGQAYFVTNGEPRAFFDFVEEFLTELGYPPITGTVPYWLAYAVAAIAESWNGLKGGALAKENGLSRFAVRYMVTHHYFNIAKAQRELDWSPAISLQQGIKLSAAAWMR